MKDTEETWVHTTKRKKLNWKGYILYSESNYKKKKKNAANKKKSWRQLNISGCKGWSGGTDAEVEYKDF